MGPDHQGGEHPVLIGPDEFRRRAGFVRWSLDCSYVLGQVLYQCSALAQAWSVRGGRVIVQGWERSLETSVIILSYAGWFAIPKFRLGLS